MDEKKLIGAVETILFAIGRGVSVEYIKSLLEKTYNESISQKEIIEALKKIKEFYNGSFGLKVYESNELWFLSSKEEFVNVIANLTDEVDLTKSVLETLAVIAWKAPVLQSEIIELRNVKAYEHIEILEKRGFIKCEKLGNTKLIKLTDKFFDYFDLEGSENLKELFSQRLKEFEEKIKQKKDKNKKNKLEINFNENENKDERIINDSKNEPEKSDHNKNEKDNNEQKNKDMIKEEEELRKEKNSSKNENNPKLKSIDSTNKLDKNKEKISLLNNLAENLLNKSNKDIQNSKEEGDNKNNFKKENSSNDFKTNEKNDDKKSDNEENSSLASNTRSQDDSKLTLSSLDYENLDDLKDNEENKKNNEEEKKEDNKRNNIKKNTNPLLELKKKKIKERNPEIDEGLLKENEKKFQEIINKFQEENKKDKIMKELLEDVKELYLNNNEKNNNEKEE
ncbi:MAG: SMC-Scp complex subunit ScpB [Candidatus Woesearchaeota archaeon]